MRMAMVQDISIDTCITGEHFAKNACNLVCTMPVLLPACYLPGQVLAVRFPLSAFSLRGWSPVKPVTTQYM
jgi:hypothetical protein